MMQSVSRCQAESPPGFKRDRWITFFAMFIGCGMVTPVCLANKAVFCSPSRYELLLCVSTAFSVVQQAKALPQEHYLESQATLPAWRCGYD